MRFLPVQPHVVLVELDDLPHVLALLDALRSDPVDGIEELVPAARTLLVRFRPEMCSRARLIELLRARQGGAVARAAEGELVEIPVHYDGEDLAEVADYLHLTPADVVRRHAGSIYTVAFTGFAPGFAYLAGGDPLLDVPRRKTPRTRIPAGAVGLAGVFSGVYPQASPGGWQIIGTTPLAMWDLSRQPPALLQPGQRVRFVDMDAAGTGSARSTPRAAAVQVTQAASPLSAVPTLPQARSVAEARAPAAAPASATAAAGFEVCQAGLQTLFQDGGRPGLAGMGVSASGALDQGAFRQANRLVGNPAHLPVLETLACGLQLRSRGDSVVAVTGARVPLSLTAADGTRWHAQPDAPVALAAGDTLTLGLPTAGVRCYVAVRGGFAVAPVLGSCATDTLARLGPAPVAAGDLLAVMPPRPGQVVGDPDSAPPVLPTAQDCVVLDVLLGPRTDWFTPEAVARLASSEWTVTPQSNRVGLRLAGEEPLVRACTGELPSEGTPTGAIQVPPSGQPVLFLADHPLTGGYPVIACVAPHHLDLAGQIPVGARIRFRPLSAFVVE